MGCWKEDIYGGDVALDRRTSIYGICNFDEFDSSGNLQPIPVELLDSKMVEIQENIDSEDNDTINIGYLVLAAVIMHSGGELSESIKQNVLYAIKHDSWANDNQVRKLAMRNYNKLVSEYVPGESINVEEVNLLGETDPTTQELLAEDFRQVFGIITARKAKLKRSLEEKSGVDEYDEGFADAASEEIDFLEEFGELLEKYEQFGELLEKIEDGMSNGFSGIAGTSMGKVSIGNSGGGKDVMPG